MLYKQGWQELKDWLKNRKGQGWGSLTISVLLEKMEQLEGKEEEMREIKFRLVDKDNKIVGYERWHPELGKWLYSLDNVHWKPDYILHKFKDQFSGFKDKNLYEIYEADEVQIFVGTLPPGVATGEVIFENGKFGIPAPDLPIGPKFIDLAWDVIRTVIIGNTHHTPRTQGGTS